MNSISVKIFWHEAQETNQGRRDRFYTEIVIRLSRWSRRLLLQNLHSEHDNLCITPHLMKLLMNWFCYIQFHCVVNTDCLIEKFTKHSTKILLYWVTFSTNNLNTRFNLNCVILSTFFSVTSVLELSGRESTGSRF